MDDKSLTDGVTHTEPVDVDVVSYLLPRVEKLQFSLARNAARTEECLCTHPYVAALASGLRGLRGTPLRKTPLYPRPRRRVS